VTLQTRVRNGCVGVSLVLSLFLGMSCGTGYRISATRTGTSPVGHQAAPAAASPPQPPPPPASAEPRGVLAGGTPNASVLAPPTTIRGNASSSRIVQADISYPSGWNLVALVAAGSAPFPLGLGPAYRLPTTPFAVNYFTVPAGQALGTGSGYWIYFPTPVTLHVSGQVPDSTQFNVYPGYTMIGNSGPNEATVAGAAFVYVYEPGTGYRLATTLAPGQGGFAYSETDGFIRIVNP
jgi:hypothetical protein